MAGGGGCCLAITATILGVATRGWGAVLLGQPAIWTVPLAFCVMIVTSLLTRQALPDSVDQMLKRMHLPEALMQRGYQPAGTLPAQEKTHDPSDRKPEPLPR